MRWILLALVACSSSAAPKKEPAPSCQQALEHFTSPKFTCQLGWPRWKSLGHAIEWCQSLPRVGGCQDKTDALLWCWSHARLDTDPATGKDTVEGCDCSRQEDAAVSCRPGT